MRPRKLDSSAELLVSLFALRSSLVHDMQRSARTTMGDNRPTRASLLLSTFEGKSIPLTQLITRCLDPDAPPLRVPLGGKKKKTTHPEEPHHQRAPRPGTRGLPQGAQPERAVLQPVRPGLRGQLHRPHVRHARYAPGWSACAVEGGREPSGGDE